MSTNLQNKNKRITKQIRVSIRTHRDLKSRAVKEDTTISKLADFVIGEYFKRTNDLGYEK